MKNSIIFTCMILLLLICLVAGFGTRYRLNAAGIIECCYKRSNESISSNGRDFDPEHYFCSYAPHTTIELYDHFEFLSDELLFSTEITSGMQYDIEWEGKRFFNFDPYIKFNVTCQGGSNWVKQFWIIENTKLMNVNQNCKVEVK